MLKFILSMFLFVSTLQAATVTSQHDNYNAGQTMLFSLTDMLGDQDWIGIYPADANNDWENVVAWKWTGDIINGDISINSIPSGNYEVRIFFNNSFTLEASDAFSVSENQQNTTISVYKDNYNAGESVIVSLSNMPGNNNDWVGIYPAGSSNDWGNVVAWKFTNGVVNGDINLGIVPTGDYEARVFFNNSFTLEAQDTFSMSGAVNNATITTNKESYENGESVVVTVTNMAGNNNDWVGIYPAGSNNDWGNVVAWSYTNGIVNGDINLGVVATGDYEARAFFNNSFTLEASDAFTVLAINLPPTVYEDAENGLANWVTVNGPYQARLNEPGFESSANVAFTAQWEQLDNGYWQNNSEFHLDMNNNSQKTLSLDLVYNGPGGGAGGHYAFGVRVTTTQGVRRLMWTHFYNHNNINANIRYYGDVAFITSPEPGLNQDRTLVGGGTEYEWHHLDIDLEEVIQQFEPNNTLLSVEYFITTGGGFDNITLK